MDLVPSSLYETSTPVPTPSAKPAVDENFTDEAILWLKDRLSHVLKPISAEALDALLRTEESSRILGDFLSDRARRVIFIAHVSDARLALLLSLPTDYKKTFWYVLKLRRFALDAAHYSNIVCGSSPASLLEHLSLVSHEVFYPVINGFTSSDAISEVSQKELTESLQKYLSQLYLTVGHARGITLLPLPPKEVLPSGEKVSHKDKESVHVLEGFVVTWTRLIKNVLKADNSIDVRETDLVGTAHEFAFWSSREDTLRSLCDQVQHDRMRKALRMLELSKSTYYAPFLRLTRELSMARVEASEVATFLRPMQRLVAAFSHSLRFVDLIPLFRPIMHLLFLVWKSSRYFNTSSRLQIFLQKLSNDVVSAAGFFLSGDDVFELEPEEVDTRLRSALKVCVAMKNAYMDYKDRTERDVPMNPWRAQEAIAFASVDSYIERCHDMLDFTQARIHFRLLGAVELDSFRGRALARVVKQVSLEFHQAVTSFRSLRSTPTPPSLADDSGITFWTCVSNSLMTTFTISVVKFARWSAASARPSPTPSTRPPPSAPRCPSSSASKAFWTAPPSRRRCRSGSSTSSTTSARRSHLSATRSRRHEDPPPFPVTCRLTQGACSGYAGCVSGCLSRWSC